MGRVIRGSRKGKSLIFTAKTRLRKGAVKLRSICCISQHGGHILTPRARQWSRTERGARMKETHAVPAWIHRQLRVATLAPKFGDRPSDAALPVRPPPATGTRPASLDTMVLLRVRGRRSCLHQLGGWEDRAEELDPAMRRGAGALSALRVVLRARQPTRRGARRAGACRLGGASCRGERRRRRGVLRDRRRERRVRRAPHQPSNETRAAVSILEEL